MRARRGPRPGSDQRTSNSSPPVQHRPLPSIYAGRSRAPVHRRAFGTALVQAVGSQLGSQLAMGRPCLGAGGSSGRDPSRLNLSVSSRSISVWQRNGRSQRREATLRCRTAPPVSAAPRPALRGVGGRKDEQDGIRHPASGLTQSALCSQRSSFLEALVNDAFQDAADGNASRIAPLDHRCIERMSEFWNSPQDRGR